MNPDQVLHLLKIMDLAKQWPQFQALHDIAREELIEANAEAQVELAKRAKDKAEAKAKRQAEIDAKAQAERDEQERLQANAYKQAADQANREQPNRVYERPVNMPAGRPYVRPEPFVPQTSLSNEPTDDTTLDRRL